MGQKSQFSERENQVIELLIQGKSNKQIALALNISLRTAEYHLSHIYAKLGVTSRTEAALILSQTDLRESAGTELRESTVLKGDESGDNVEAPTSTWRLPVKKDFLIALVILIATAVFCYVSLYIMMKERAEAHDAELNAPQPTSIPVSTLAVPSETSSPAVSPKEHIIEQIRQLAAEYEQAVQAEKKNGEVEFSKDTTTGDDIFIFKNDSYVRIWDRNVDLWEDIRQLNTLYVQIYRDELRPTPFPTQSSPEQNEAYLHLLYEQAKDYCPTRELDPNKAIAMIYDPDEGKYSPLIIDEELVRCETYGQMIEEFRTAPMLAKVNKEADMVLIREMMGKPDWNLTFQSVSEVPNAPWRSAALYTDKTGTRYYVDVDTARLAAIEPNLPDHPEIPASETKIMDELRVIARQFAFTYSPRLAELESVLLYQENCKFEICFFRWEYRNKDWTGTDWAMMSPFLQVGVQADGQILTYNNTLDLFE